MHRIPTYGVKRLWGEYLCDWMLFLIQHLLQLFFVAILIWEILSIVDKHPRKTEKAELSSAFEHL